MFFLLLLRFHRAQHHHHLPRGSQNPGAVEDNVWKANDSPMKRMKRSETNESMVPSGSKWFPILGPTSGNPISGPSPQAALHTLAELSGRSLGATWERPTQMFQGSNPFIVMCHLVSH